MTLVKMKDRKMSDAYINPVEDEVNLLKYKLQTLLRDNVMEITFTKVDGTERLMKCTLCGDLIPVPGWKPGSEGFIKENKRKTPEDNLTVWDVDKKDWRSFRVDSVLDYMTIRSEF